MPKRNVNEIRKAIVTYLETEGLSTMTEMREKLSKALEITEDDIEKNLLFLQTKDKIAQKTVSGKQVWFVGKPTKEKADSPRDYKNYKRKIIFTVPCLGTYPITGVYWIKDELEKRQFLSKMGYDGKTMFQVHEQRRCDGKNYVWSDWIRGLLRDGMYLVDGKTKSCAQNHIKISDAEIHVMEKGTIQTHVSVGGGTQGGIVFYEGIMPGSWAEISLMYPSNQIKEEELDQIFEIMGESKGFGANHSRGYGKFNVEAIE